MSSRLAAAERETIFPSGDSQPLAVLVAEPAALAARHRIAFSEGLDDLDRFRYAVLDLGHGHPLVLLKHAGDRNPGTVVRIDAGDDPARARERLSAALGLGEADVLWWAPGA